MLAKLAVLSLRALLNFNYQQLNICLTEIALIVLLHFTSPQISFKTRLRMAGSITQYYTVLCANLTIFVYGIAVGWPSANLPLLTSSDSPLPSGPMTLFEASWIGSILCIGGAIGTIGYGWFAEVVGRKKAMLSIFIPTVV